VIGRHCILTSQTGISGSVVMGDNVVTAGQAGVADHLTIGAGAQLGAQSGSIHDVPAGARWMGTPAKPARQFFREFAALERLAKQGRTGRKAAESEEGS
jgi:UDP-3-O-[3-hydroxymyristoyl] glucosamine N-acyltransferase